MEDYSQYRPSQFEYSGKWIFNWFSNLVSVPILVDGEDWPSVENYYQAQKTMDSYTRFGFKRMAPSQAKRAGRNLVIRPDWENIKYEVMKTALRAKFSDPMWGRRLLDTGDEILIEWNNWGDKVWGVSIKDNKGHNLLGKALMEIRDELFNNEIKKQLKLAIP